LTVVILSHNSVQLAATQRYCQQQTSLKLMLHMSRCDDLADGNVLGVMIQFRPEQQVGLIISAGRYVSLITFAAFKQGRPLSYLIRMHPSSIQCLSTTSLFSSGWPRVRVDRCDTAVTVFASGSDAAASHTVSRVGHA